MSLLALAERIAPRRRRHTWPDPAAMAREVSAGRWQPAPHLDLLAQAIAATHAEPDGRLLVHMPPRHGKTLLTGQWAPAWALSQNPELRVILASYTLELARDNSVGTRSIVRELMATEQAGVALAADSTAAHRWHTADGGGVYAVGLGGSITGFGGDIIIVDDPVKSREDAESPTFRARAWDWYRDTLYTRLEPGASLIVVATRWHPDDLPGRILKHAATTGETWRVINLPALADAGDPLGRAPGDPLWPERYDVPALERIRATLGPRGWASLYQQQPIATAGGAYWTAELVEQAQAAAPDELPTFARLVVSVDPPASSEPGADEAGIVVCGCERPPLRRGAVLEDLSGVMDPEAWGKAAVEAFVRWRADTVVAEKNQGGEMVRAVIHAAARKMGVPRPPVRLVHARRGKALRAEPVAQQFRQGNVWMRGSLPRLADQMLSWTPESTDSPDRLDAMVHGLTHVMRLDGGGETWTA